MEEHVLSPYAPLLCSPTYTVKGETGASQTFNNWTRTSNQWMDLKTALAESCDTYFYQVGYDVLPTCRRAAATRCRSWASRFGFGAADRARHRRRVARARAHAGVAARGVRAARKYTAVDRTWNPGYSVQLAIGQGDLLVTPLQMARFYAMLANGGELVTPHVGADVEQPTDDPQVAAGPAALRRPAADAERRRPGRDPDRPRRPLRGDALADRHLVRRLRQLPGPDRRQDGHGGEVGERPRPVDVAEARASRGGAAGARSTSRRSSSAP